MAKRRSDERLFEQLWICKIRKSCAQGVLLDPKTHGGAIMVLKGSGFYKTKGAVSFLTAPGLRTARIIREKMLARKLVKPSDDDADLGILVEDLIFSSLSLAACVLQANSRSGPDYWIHEVSGLSYSSCNRWEDKYSAASSSAIDTESFH